MSQTWFSKRQQDEIFLVLINDLHREKDVWAASLLAAADIKGEIPTSSGAADLFQSTKEDVQCQIDVMRDAQTSYISSRAQKALYLAGLSQKQWSQDRQKGSGKAGAKFQASMTEFSQFLENFSGIVDIAQTADQQYGGLAWGTLSLMLSVFVQKTKREEALDSGFEELSFAFPRLKTLQRLRHECGPNDTKTFHRLEDLITKTFGQVVTFAKEAAIYYSSRWRRTVVDPWRPATSKQATLGEIRKTLVEIRSECDILMLTRITSLHELMEKMSVVGQSTQAGVSSSNRSSDLEHLAKLREMLSVDPKSKHLELKRYKSLLEEKFFSEHRTRSKRCHPKMVSMDLLRNDDDFRAWYEGPKSSVLMAGGRNYSDDYRNGSLTWLSYGAIVMVEELRRREKHVVHFLVQTGLYVESSERPSSKQIVEHLLYQIAEIHESQLRIKLDTIKAAVKHSSWTAKAGDDFVDRAQSLLQDVLSEFRPGEEIFIVIDRLDQCEWELDDDMCSDVAMRHDVEGLLRVAANVRCRVKILLVVDAESTRRLLRSTLQYPQAERKMLVLKREWYQVMEED